MTKKEREFSVADLELISNIESKQKGWITFANSLLETSIEKTEGGFFLQIAGELDMDVDTLVMPFENQSMQFSVKGTITGHHNHHDLIGKTHERYSKVKAYSFQSEEWSTGQARIFRTYLPTTGKDLLYDQFGAFSKLSFAFNAHQLFIHQEEGFLVLATENVMDYETFEDCCYNILVAIGFITGKFIQGESYTFYDEPAGDAGTALSRMRYRKLRPGFSSIYHALVWNPYGYKYALGKEEADSLYRSKNLIPMDKVTLSNLVTLLINSTELRYALVLFNEANGNGLSLLIKNNCFFAVLEVLKKYIYDLYLSELPGNYSNQKNIDKYRTVFSQLFPVSEKEMFTFRKRNVFLHGDIKDMEGTEMIETMQQQITLIYKIVLTHAGFNGYIIDHYQLRNGGGSKSFIKLRQF